MITSTVMSVVLAPTPAVPAAQRTTLLAQIDGKELARELLTTKQYKCFSSLIGKESAWSENARNPHSSAKGVGQLLDGTYRNLGMKHSQVEAAQVVAALAYIGRKYGSSGPCGAWKHWQTKRWY
jgi:SLT domain-containing protein